MTTESSVGSPLLEVQGLHVRLGGREVIDDVSFSIKRGDSLALVGESGSGKTVTARVVTGLIDRIGGVVTSGRVVFDGQELRQGDNQQWAAIRGRRMALVPQASLSSLDPVMRVGKQLAETVSVLDAGADVRPRSLELLEQVHMPRPQEVLRAFPHELSGGMRQRVMIALALAGRPELIVADEPTTALDVTVQAGILRLLGELRRETGMTLLMIAHDLAVVGLVSDEVAVMRSGRLLESGATATVLSTPEHAYTKALLAARPEASKPGAPLAVLDRETGELRAPAALPSVATDGAVVLTVKDATVTYRHASSPALAPVSLDIQAGASIGLVGESGSGKTTLGRVIVGALRPTTGEVLVHGKTWQEVRGRNPIRRDVQMIFQDPYGSLTPWRTPRQAVAEVLQRWRGLSRSASLAQAGDLLDEVGLPRLTFDKLPRQLSGGQCQRVGIARALASEPRLIVADEPTSSLDISAQAQILNLLMSLRASHGLSLVLISHDLSVIRHMTDTALVMKNGVVVERGPSTKLFTDPDDEYTRQLVAATPVLDSVPGVTP
ncbi:dipeptide ABC transporter ATP-binding protein [Naasia aerilata]|uniref:ABC transporter ATP-binding protein n=1 Tax=Naasia aerilata TaxID=1162966 RepID=A0ABN6XMQ6_9MICO|nr:ABC transporter ATP-binding protein [Naasia aerilata]BDZ46176.1 ABC transporter ATP-binding protein [Naasia aerilata]